MISVPAYSPPRVTTSPRSFSDFGRTNSFSSLSVRQVRQAASSFRNQPGDDALPRALAITAVIGAGLIFDQHLEFWGQTLTNVGVWVLFLYWLHLASPRDQVALTACVVYATLGELFLSLVWGLYEYRLANVPLFVPPGHALLFMLGAVIAARLRDWIIWFVPLAAAPFVCLLLVTGADTLGALLFAMFVLCLLFGAARKLYAVMFVLALAMEIYGTRLGNWVWSHEVPWLGLTTLNPPLAAGAFYCVLDLLIVATVARAPAGAQPYRVRLAAAIRLCRYARLGAYRAAAVPVNRTS